MELPATDPCATDPCAADPSAADPSAADPSTKKNKKKKAISDGEDLKVVSKRRKRVDFVNDDQILSERITNHINLILPENTEKLGAFRRLICFVIKKYLIVDVERDFLQIITAICSSKDVIYEYQKKEKKEASTHKAYKIELSWIKKILSLIIEKFKITTNLTIKELFFEKIELDKEMKFTKEEKFEYYYKKDSIMNEEQDDHVFKDDDDETKKFIRSILSLYTESNIILLSTRQKKIKASFEKWFRRNQKVSYSLLIII